LERMNGAPELRELVRLRLGLLMRREGRLDSRTVLGGVRELETRLREHGLWRGAGPEELAALGENVEKLVTLRLHARLFQVSGRGRSLRCRRSGGGLVQGVGGTWQVAGMAYGPRGCVRSIRADACIAVRGTGV
jgi:hypothetical protein